MRGNLGPTAVARVKSINGGAVSDISATPLHLLPLDDVVLTGVDSVPDPEVKAALRKAANEWERRTETRR